MKKIRNNRNPRYQEALNLAEENNALAKKQTEHNFQNILNLSNIDSEITRIGLNIKKLALNVVPRNERLTDAYIKMSGRYSDIVNILSRREDRIDLLVRELKNYVPDHYLFAGDAAEDEPEDNTDEPEPEQQEFDFGEIIKRRPN